MSSPAGKFKATFEISPGSATAERMCAVTGGEYEADATLTATLSGFSIESLGAILAGFVYNADLLSIRFERIDSDA